MTVKPLSLAISTFKGGAGKSTLNVNLAAEFAQQGHRTLLIDCDEQIVNALVQCLYEAGTVAD